MRFSARVFVATSLLCMAMPSHAATITRKFTFSGSGFGYAVPGVAPPYQTVSGSFTLSYDPTLSYTNEASGIVLNSLSLPISPQSLVFSYSAFGPPFLRVGGAQNGVGYQLGNTTDFSLNIFDAAGSNPFGGPLDYTAPGFFISSFIASRVELSFVDVAAIPAPSTWIMFILGFGILGSALRERVAAKQRRRGAQALQRA